MWEEDKINEVKQMRKLRIALGSEDGINICPTHLGMADRFYIYELWENGDYKLVEWRLNSSPQEKRHADPEKRRAITEILKDCEIFVGRKLSPNFIKLRDNTQFQPVLTEIETISDLMDELRNFFPRLFDLVERRRRGARPKEIPQVSKPLTLSHIYGPVPSRRLGFSLGVDLVPYKTCSFDCIYCQLGGTTERTVERREWVPQGEVLSQIREALATRGRIDYITFSGSGEPTLHSGLGWLIREIKKVTDIPVAVLTNGSLLFREDLRGELLAADLVVPSLDAGTQKTLERVNRPHPFLNLKGIIQGLLQFRREFKGRLWLEVMLVEGINDTEEEVGEMVKIVGKLRPDKVHLNTVVRPPSEGYAHPLSTPALQRIKASFGPGCEIIAGFKGEREEPYLQDMEGGILELVRRRPVTLSDIAHSLGLHENEVIKCLQVLEERGMVKTHWFEGERYYKPGV